LKKIRSISNKPITSVINTHTYADHTGGNSSFPPGIQFVAHENTKTNMEKMDLFKQADNRAFLPNKTFKDKLTLFSRADEVDLHYFGVSGTNGDAWIVIPSVRILAAGDGFALKSINLIDESNGGSADQARTIRNAVNGIKNVDAVLSGHGSTMYTWDDFKEFADYNEDFLKWALAEKKMGKTADEAAAEYQYPPKVCSLYPDECAPR
jgi:glyoxylase-like metal-dependent hydrolase (beta-lactamase superfamily II)